MKQLKTKPTGHLFWAPALLEPESLVLVCCQEYGGNPAKASAILTLQQSNAEKTETRYVPTPASANLLFLVDTVEI